MRGCIPEDLLAAALAGRPLPRLCVRGPSWVCSVLAVAALCSTAALLGACARSLERPAQPISALTCRPLELRPGDTLELTMRTPHGGHLGVIAPGDFWFFLIYPQPQAERPPLMPPHQFRNVARLALPVSSTKALPWVHGYNDAMLVFRRPGPYKIVVGENLLSHDYPVSSCTVKFMTAMRR